MRTAFTRIGFSNEAAAAIVNREGIDDPEELALLTDTDVINLCKVVRRPGGTLPNPQAGNAGEPATLPNYGIAVSLRAETNMNLAAYYARFRDKTSRITTAAELILDPIRSVRGLRDWEDAHKPADPPEKIINPKDWNKTLEGIEEYLRGCLGVTKIPLAYVVRDTEAIVDDPDAGIATRGWPSLQDELINRAPITTGANNTHSVTYLTDRATVYDKIAALTRDKACWTYVKPFQRTRDGRAAFLALRDHYLGENMVDAMASAAERALTTLKYIGEKRRWNFEAYASAHVEQHGILEGLASKGQHVGLDERTKVRYLMDGITTKDLDNVRTQILSDPQIRSDFARCVTLYKDYLTAVHNTTGSPVGTTNVSAVNARGNGTPTATPTITLHERDIKDRYYSHKEYLSISPKGRKKLKRIRDERGYQPTSSKKPRTDSAMVKAIATSVIAQIEAANAQTEVASNTNGGTPNRNHPALTRQQQDQPRTPP
jgi:hypothetical protein